LKNSFGIELRLVFGLRGGGFGAGALEDLTLAFRNVTSLEDLQERRKKNRDS
jgi:hypothetical protein